MSREDIRAKSLMLFRERKKTAPAAGQANARSPRFPRGTWKAKSSVVGLGQSVKAYVRPLKFLLSQSTNIPELLNPELAIEAVWCQAVTLERELQ